MITTVLLSLGALLSFWMVIQSIIWFWNASRCKTIIDLPFQDGLQHIHITEPGLYVVKVLGAHRISVPPKVTVKSAEATMSGVDQWPPLIPFRGRSQGRRTVELVHFNIERPERYTLEIRKSSAVQAHTSPLRVLAAFSRIAAEKLELRIAQTIPWWHRSLSILFLVFGVNGAAWCTLFLFWPNAFR